MTPSNEDKSRQGGKEVLELNVHINGMVGFCSLLKVGWENHYQWD